MVRGSGDAHRRARSSWSRSVARDRSSPSNCSTTRLRGAPFSWWVAVGSGTHRRWAGMRSGGRPRPRSRTDRRDRWRVAVRLAGSCTRRGMVGRWRPCVRDSAAGARLVSVVIPARDGAAGIGAMVRAALYQRAPGVVVDGVVVVGSGDGTAEVSRSAGGVGRCGVHEGVGGGGGGGGVMGAVRSGGGVSRPGSDRRLPCSRVNLRRGPRDPSGVV